MRNKRKLNTIMKFHCLTPVESSPLVGLEQNPPLSNVAGTFYVPPKRKKLRVQPHTYSKGFLQRRIKKIIRNNNHCYFISPHFDDAVLSAGGLLSYLANKVPVTVINVFTKGDKGPYTLATKLYLSRCGYKDAVELFSERMKEDEEVFKKLGVEVVNLGYMDAFWRKKEGINEMLKLMGKLIPELIHLYPSYKFHMGPDKISNHDFKLKINLENNLRNLIKTKDTVIFCPVGLGKHADHTIVRDVCSNIFDSAIYWSDFNYSMDVSGRTKFITDKNLIMDYFDKELSLKDILIKGYKSQRYAIFPHGKVLIVPDFYYFKTEESTKRNKNLVL